MNRLARLFLLRVCATAIFPPAGFAAPAAEIESGLGRVDPPLRIELLQDVELQVLQWQTPAPLPGQAQGPQYVVLRLKLRKGESFGMTEVMGEGSCRIEVEDSDYLLADCPWLAGFRDHQEHLFRVLR